MSFFDHIAILCNPKADTPKGYNIAEKLGLILQARQIKFTMHAAIWPETFEDTSSVWLVGGDGTLNYFINQYPDINIPLSIFPGGTGNDFSWMLYREIAVEQQAEMVLSSKPKWVDAGICNGRLFLNGVGIGFDGAIVKDLLGKKKLAGKSSYMLSVLKNILSFTEKPCTIRFQDQVIEQSSLMISVANGRRYGGGFTVAPRADVFDGKLDLNIVGKIDAFQRIRYLPVIEKGEHLDLHFNKFFTTDSVSIDFEKEVHAHLDGEYLSAKHFDIKVLPEKFLFLVN
jgi:diacylglycerol kinase (ATP)